MPFTVKDDNPIDFMIGGDLNDATEEEMKLYNRSLEIYSEMMFIFKGTEGNKEQDLKLKRSFEDYVSYVKAGLVYKNIPPGMAQELLGMFLKDLIDNEGGNLKSRYLNRLNVPISIFVILSFIIGVGMTHSGFWFDASYYLFIWFGSCIGVWLGMAMINVKKVIMELKRFEQNHLTPVYAIIYAGVLAEVSFLILKNNLVLIEFGSISSGDVGKNFEITILFGILAGLVYNTAAERIQGAASDVFVKKS